MPAPLLALLSLVLAAAPGEPVAPEPVLGEEVILAGAALRLPPEFVPLPLRGRETAALAPGDSEARRELLGAFENAGADASLLVSSIDETLEDGPDLRDRLAKATVDHFREELELDLRLSWATRGRAPAALVEVAGRFPLGDQERGVVVAFVPSAGRTYVLTLSAPASQLERLTPGFEAAVRSFRAAPEREGGEPLPARWILAAVGGALGLAVWLVLRRRGK